MRLAVPRLGWLRPKAVQQGTAVPLRSPVLLRTWARERRRETAHARLEPYGLSDYLVLGSALVLTACWILALIVGFRWLLGV
jgi:hypothetical protein